MTNAPYDVFPVANKGDEHPDAIYTQVGRALSMWESIEENLARIFALIVGVDAFDKPSPVSKAYGAIATAKGRIEMVKAAAEIAFEARPTQLKNVSKFLNTCIKFGARRNDIAHGVAYKMTFTLGDVQFGDDGFYLVPPFYNTNKQPNFKNSFLRLGQNEDSRKKAVAEMRKIVRTGTGKYKYNSEQIGKYADSFRALEGDALALIAELVAERKA